MANNVSIEWNDAGFVEILQSEGVRELVLSQAERIATAATANISDSALTLVSSVVATPATHLVGFLTALAV